MSVGDLRDGSAVADARSALAAVAVPALVGALAVAEGYPLPAAPAEAVPVAGTGAALALLGLVGWWCWERGRRTALAVAVAGVGAGALGSLLRPGVTAARVGGDAVLAGDPLLARFAGVAPWVVVAVGVLAAVEPILPGLRALSGGDAPTHRRRTRRDALRLGAAAGVALAVLSVLPVYLLASGFGDPSLLGFAVGGGFAGGLAVAYPFARHGLVTPVLALGVTAAAAAVAVATGGSPVGFPTAWPVWLVLGLLLGGVESLGRWLVSLVR